MKHKRLARLLKINPFTIGILLKDVEKRYNRMCKEPKGQPFRGRQKKTKSREIIAPAPGLKKVQRAIADLLSREFAAHHIAHGYVKGASVASNARVHVGAKLLLKVDLVNFFGSIGRQAVMAALHRELKGYVRADLETIADLCCYNGYLPQGSPASPILSNMVCYPLDEQLDQLARSLGCKVSRFSDDIGFSSAAASFPHELVESWHHGVSQQIELGERLSTLLAVQGFEINWEKLKVQSRGSRMEMTGVIVGESGIGTLRRYRNNLRSALHRWEKEGLIARARKLHRTGCTRAFANRLQGCIAHVGDVEGRDQPRFQRLLQSFEALLQRDRAQLCPVVDSLNQRCGHSRRASLP